MHNGWINCPKCELKKIRKEIIALASQHKIFSLNFMAETLGSLCDKLTIVKLKQWHSKDESKLKSLDIQQNQLQSEINEFINDAVSGNLPIERLTFASNKVYKQELNAVPDVAGSIGEVFSQLAEVNCKLWHEQEKVYDFEKVPLMEKNKVVKQLAVLNLKRNNCIDKIDRNFQMLISKFKHL